jgi:hypothetical protein
VNAEIEQGVSAVLKVIGHAQKVFGGETPPTPPPDFAAPRDTEDNLGRGHFCDSQGR